jgi:DNA-binding NtrC family response regulator
MPDIDRQFIALRKKIYELLNQQVETRGIRKKEITQSLRLEDMPENSPIVIIQNAHIGDSVKKSTNILEILDNLQTEYSHDKYATLESIVTNMYSAALSHDEMMRRFEQALFDVVLRRHKGNKAKAAASLGMNRTTLVERLKRLECKAIDI